jgi:SAM-dependent methyltransferase
MPDGCKEAHHRRVTEATYYFDTATETDRQRLAAQSALWDPFTFRNLAEVGVTDGWRCLEVGAGAGSVASWLCERVGDGGHVVATDLETRWLEPLSGPTLEVRRHDVVADPLEENAFDLIHTRLVLMHLPQRDEVIEKLAGALRPGGWLVVDDYDLRTISDAQPPHPAWTKVSEASAALLAAKGADTRYGHKLPYALESVGLTDVSAEGLVLLRRAPGMAGPLVPLLERMRQPMLAAGDVSAAEFDQVMEELTDETSRLAVMSPIMVSARGRRG